MQILLGFAYKMSSLVRVTETELPDNGILRNLLNYEGLNIINGMHRVIISFKFLKLSLFFDNFIHVDNTFYKFYKPHCLKTCR